MDILCFYSGFVDADIQIDVDVDVEGGEGDADDCGSSREGDPSPVMRGVGPSAQFTNHPPSGPHPPIPNSPIVLVQLRPLVDVDALLTLLLLSPLSLSLSLSLFDRYHHCS